MAYTNKIPILDKEVVTQLGTEKNNFLANIDGELKQLPLQVVTGNFVTSDKLGVTVAQLDEAGKVPKEQLPITLELGEEEGTAYEGNKGKANADAISELESAVETLQTDKQDALDTQTAYTKKGTKTKIPQITTNEYGQVTEITEQELDPSVEVTIATTETAGIVKPDGTTIEVDEDGTIRAKATPITVDEALSIESENPVQNKVITTTMQGMKLIYNDVTVSADAWVDSEVEEYPVKAVIALEGVTANHTPNVVFDLYSATCGVFAPVCESGAGTVTIYATETPNGSLTIPTIICESEVAL